MITLIKYMKTLVSNPQKIVYQHEKKDNKKVKKENRLRIQLIEQILGIYKL